MFTKKNPKKFTEKTNVIHIRVSFFFFLIIPFHIPDTYQAIVLSTLIWSVNNTEATNPDSEWNVIEIVLSASTWLPEKAINLTIYRQPSRSLRRRRRASVANLLFLVYGQNVSNRRYVTTRRIRDTVTFLTYIYIHYLSPYNII